MRNPVFYVCYNIFVLRISKMLPFVLCTSTKSDKEEMMGFKSTLQISKCS